MPTRPDRPKPDRLHVLPHPRPPIDPATQPFVGNESVDDNLAELAQVAMWNAIGAADRGVRVTVKDGVATLAGVLADKSQRKAVEQAVAAVPGIAGIRSAIRIPRPAPVPAPPVIAEARRIEPEPFVYVTRFCGLEAASTSAAIKGAIAELDEFLAAVRQPPAETLIVVYRNRLPAAITLDIGVPVPAGIADMAAGSLRSGRSPGGLVVETMPGEGIAGVVAASERLVAHAAIGSRDGFRSTWQRFDAARFRPWHEHPRVPVLLSVADG